MPRVLQSGAAGINQQFREIVNQRLGELGWSRSDLARAMSVRPGYVTNYLNARNKAGMAVMERFFRAVGLRVDLEGIPVEQQ